MAMKTTELFARLERATMGEGGGGARVSPGTKDSQCRDLPTY